MTTITDTFLTHEEVQTLTERKVRTAQVKVLRAMGIEHRVRPDGSVAILRAHIFKVFDGSPEAKKQTKQVEPNWEAM